MADGAYISLQPNTEFGIRDYKFEGRADGSENAFYSLLKGAMRTVTGLIGRVNRNKYLVSTPTATVGIRGTGGLIHVQDDGSTLVRGTSGIWFLSNPAGTIDIPAGVSGVAPVDPSKPPVETVDVPLLGPVHIPTLLESFRQGELLTLLSGPGYAAVLGDGDAATGSAGPGSYIGTTVFNGSGQLVQFEPTAQLIDTPRLIEEVALISEVQILPADTTYTLLSGSRHADFGTDGVTAWGRWIDDVSVFGTVVNYSPSQGLHYVVGLPTPVMPLVGTATYNLLGATRPTYTDGSAAPGTFGGSLSVDFLLLTVGLNLNVGIDGKSYSINGGAGILDNAFSSSLTNAIGPATVTGSGGACVAGANGCSAQVDGFFAGLDAIRAGLGYQISDSGTGKTIEGAAAFIKQ
jgi:hypothetical protein